MYERRTRGVIMAPSKMARVSSSSSISTVSDELLLEILCRLGSSKHAVQCKSVSKLWSTLINTDSRNSYFMCLWRRINHNEEDEPPVALLTQYEPFKKWNDFHKIEFRHTLTYSFDSHAKQFPHFNSFDFLPEKTIRVVAAYKDLTLCCPGHREHRFYYLCNPFTKRHAALPPPPPPAGPDSYFHGGLIVYDDDGHTFKFKIMRVEYHHNNGGNSVQIFSSEDCVWRVIRRANRWRDEIPGHCCTSVSYNGMIVWRISSFDDYGFACLTGFKFDGPVVSCTNFPLPSSCFQADCASSMIGVFGGRLRLAQMEESYFYGFDSFEITVWEFDEQRKDWDLVHSLALGSIENSMDFAMAKHCLMAGHEELKCSFMGFHPQDRDVVYIFLCDRITPDDPQDPSFVFACNLRKFTLELIQVLPATYITGETFSLLMPYWPSPLPLLP